MKSRIHVDGEGLTLAILILFSALVFAFPLLLLGKVGLTQDGTLNLQALFDALQNRSLIRAFFNSLESSIASALISLLLGTIAAMLIGLSDIRRKGLITFLLLIPMMIPPHVTAIAWIQTLGPSSPLLQAVGLAPPLGSTHPLYSAAGVIFLLSIQNTPLVLLVVLAALRSLPREMSDAARVAGAQPQRILRSIIIPLLAPTLISAFALSLVSALGNFAIPALLGIPARYITLPVLIWRRLASFGPSVLNDVAVIATLLALLAIVIILLQMSFIRLSRNALIGPPQPPLQFSLGRYRKWAELGFGLFLSLVLLLPLVSLIATSLVSTYGVPLSWQTLTLSNYVEVLFKQSVTTRAFANSTIVAATAAMTVALLGVFVARILSSPQRWNRRLGAAMATLAEMTYAIPGLVISIAFILAFIHPIPLLGISLYGTLGIILLAYICAFFSIAFKPISAAYVQLDPALDEAARVSGANYLYRMRRIFVPLIAPAAASGAILVFLTAYNEVTVSALLWSSGSETIGTTIFNYEDGGYTTLAAAMSSVTVVATLLLMAALDRLRKRVPAGVIPWRI